MNSEERFWEDYNWEQFQKIVQKLKLPKYVRYKDIKFAKYTQ